MAKILLLHGPNLNLLGTREKQVYGTTDLITINRQLDSLSQRLGHTIKHFQSNVEGELIDCVHQAQTDDNIDFILINPAGLTHTSVALRDALLAVNLPFIEVHLSNVYAREAFRQHSYFADIAIGTISGFGSYSYELALLAANHYLTTNTHSNKGN